MATEAAVQSAINALFDTLSPDAVIGIIGDYLHENSVPYVIWSVEDFVAQIKENYGDIPEPLRYRIAENAFESATEELSDIRANETINEYIDGAWADWQNTQSVRTGYKLRVRNPDNRSEVRAFTYAGIDGADAHRTFQQHHPDMAHWGIASISEAD